MTAKASGKLTHREQLIAHLGFPAYFKVELTVAKILGVLALVIPTVPLAFLGLLTVSYVYFEKGHSLAAAPVPIIKGDRQACA